MSATKTSWEDLSRLGWPIYEVYKRANRERDGTMSSERDLYLNSGIAADYQWWCYNTTVGNPYIISRVPKQTSREETAWSYDNSENSRPFEDTWTEAWSNSRSATLSISAGVSIGWHNSVTIFDVASSNFDITISVNATASETKEQKYDLSHTWSIEVGPYEKVSLIRVITTSSEIAEYGQDFGLTSDSRIATTGKKWKDHWNWAFNANYLLSSPRGRLNLQGNSKAITYSFKLVRSGPKGRKIEPLPVDLRRAVCEGSLQPGLVIFEKWAAQGELAVGTEPIHVVAPGTD